MPDPNVILNALTVIILAIGGFWLFLLRSGVEAVVKTGAEEGAKAAIRQLQWPAELARELQKTRGMERQELRFKSYGRLWKGLRPLAMYASTAIDKRVVDDLSSQLSDWYFSEDGGLLLTPQARSFYFALQDLLRATSQIPQEWRAVRPSESERTLQDTFRAVLVANETDQAIEGAVLVFDYFSTGNFEEWEIKAPEYGEKWRSGINRVAGTWSELNDQQRFAALQQVGSILRTSLANDVESRLR